MNLQIESRYFFCVSLNFDFVSIMITLKFSVIIHQGDYLTSGEPENDGWLMVQNTSTGFKGFVPASYLEEFFEETPSIQSEAPQHEEQPVPYTPEWNHQSELDRGVKFS